METKRNDAFNEEEWESLRKTMKKGGIDEASFVIYVSLLKKFTDGEFKGLRESKIAYSEKMAQLRLLRDRVLQDLKESVF